MKKNFSVFLLIFYTISEIFFSTDILFSLSTPSQIPKNLGQASPFDFREKQNLSSKNSNDSLLFSAPLKKYILITLFVSIVSLTLIVLNFFLFFDRAIVFQVGLLVGAFSFASFTVLLILFIRRKKREKKIRNLTNDPYRLIVQFPYTKIFLSIFFLIAFLTMLSLNFFLFPQSNFFFHIAAFFLGLFVSTSFVTLREKLAISKRLEKEKKEERDLSANIARSKRFLSFFILLSLLFAFIAMGFMLSVFAFHVENALLLGTAYLSTTLSLLSLLFFLGTFAILRDLELEREKRAELIGNFSVEVGKRQGKRFFTLILISVLFFCIFVGGASSYILFHESPIILSLTILVGVLMILFLIQVFIVYQRGRIQKSADNENGMRGILNDYNVETFADIIARSETMDGQPFSFQQLIFYNNFFGIALLFLLATLSLFTLYMLSYGSFYTVVLPFYIVSSLTSLLLTIAIIVNDRKIKSRPVLISPVENTVFNRLSFVLIALMFLGMATITTLFFHWNIFAIFLSFYTVFIILSIAIFFSKRISPKSILLTMPESDHNRLVFKVIFSWGELLKMDSTVRENLISLDRILSKEINESSILIPGVEETSLCIGFLMAYNTDFQKSVSFLQDSLSQYQKTLSPNIKDTLFGKKIESLLDLFELFDIVKASDLSSSQFENFFTEFIKSKKFPSMDDLENWRQFYSKEQLKKIETNPLDKGLLSSVFTEKISSISDNLENIIVLSRSA